MLFADPTIAVPARLAAALVDALRPALAARVSHGLPVDPELWTLLKDCETASAVGFPGSSVAVDSSTSCGRTTEDVAMELGVSTRRVRQLIDEGRIPAYKVKGAWRI